MLRAVPSAPRSPTERSRRLHPSGTGPRPTPGPLLLVTGVPEHRALLTRLARRWRPLRLLVADGGHAGLRMCAQRRVRLVVVDAQLPDVDALEVVGALQGGDAPIVVIGHETTPREHASFVWAGASAYVGRPLNLAEIDRTVRQLVVAQPPC